MRLSLSLSRLLMLTLTFAASQTVAADDYIWVEGEAASSRKVQPHNWYSDAVKKEQLSEGAWISNFTDQADGVASYKLEVPTEAEYTLWVRANVIGALLSYRINDGEPTEIDHHQLEKMHHVIQVLKRHGIYAHVSHFFPLWMQLKASDGIAGSAIGKHPFTLPYFEPRMQAIYRDWLKQILTTTVDGKALIDEPAVACVEIINEDSLFFWTFSAAAIGDGPLATLESQFAAWLTKKYGGLDKAFAAWGKERHQRDSIDSPRAAVLDAWNMTRDGMQGDDKRKCMSTLR